MRVDSKTVSAALLEGIQAISEKNGQIAELRSINAALQSQIDSLQQRVHLCAGYDKLVAENAALKERYRWVPVSERLPEEDCICWVYYPKTKEVGQDWFTRGAFVEDCMGKESCSYFIEIHEPEPPEQPL